MRTGSMSRMTRGLVTVGLAVAMGIVAAPAAWADLKPPACSDADDTCEVGVEIPGSDGGSSGGEGSDSDPSGGGSSDGSGGSPASSVPEGECPNYQHEVLSEGDADYAQMADHAGDQPSDDHQLLVSTCLDPHTGRTLFDAAWVEPGEDGAPLLDPAVLAQQAIDSLRLPQPQIAASPAGMQLVRLPTWLWLAGDSWTGQSATASVPGLSVTASAEPVEAVWSMGDGATVTCDDAGTPWEPGTDPKRESVCGHTYTRTSADQASGEYTVTVTVTWAISWSGGGESGTAPAMSTEASTTWPVVQSQALNQ